MTGIENPKVPLKSYENLINEFNKVAGYKSSMQKSVQFLQMTMNNLKMKSRKQFH